MNGTKPPAVIIYFIVEKINFILGNSWHYYFSKKELPGIFGEIPDLPLEVQNPLHKIFGVTARIDFHRISDGVRVIQSNHVLHPAHTYSVPDYNPSIKVRYAW